MRIRIIAVLFFLLISGDAVWAYDDGNSLMENLRHYEGVSNGQKGANPVNAGIYMGYVMGVAAALNGRVICTYGRVSNGQVLEIVAKHLKEHPEKLYLAANDLVAETLKTAFPCTQP